MTAFRHLAALALALVLALTSQGLAVARGQGMAVGSAVICVGGGLAVIALDADGQPVGAPHYCPDGVLSFAAVAAPAALAPAPARLIVIAAALPVAQAAPPALNRLPPARGPPVPV